ncbi:MAG: D-glycero-beta-D-manno-heptose 1-phosphate adenylyltransferase [Saprospiraceae bacterium]|nr:D-glycero-beta-D-manno-heptose 1-phosphate adenylyltransferase [Saprospiraceae bacterium]
MSSLKHKIKNREEAMKTCQSWRASNERIVFTNGCFDLIHPGHVIYLESARALGERLVVGINSDASVKRLKGASRPVQEERARALVLAGLASIDLITIFDEDTPLELIKAIDPDILVKGGDWSTDQIVGGEYITEQGGMVKSLPFEEGYSTTSIVEKIRKNENQ